MTNISTIAGEVHACTLCKDTLEHGVRPVIQVSEAATILIAGQAPGAKVHASGIPFDDASGDRLRQWMGVSKEQFYDSSKIAILPMAFCYPGKGKSGDLPPPKICAKTWREQLLTAMPNIQLTLLIGNYAKEWHLDTRASLTETIKKYQHNQRLIVMAHPSPRNNIWLSKNSWFVDECLPNVKTRVAQALGS